MDKNKYNKIRISIQSYKLLKQLLSENQKLEDHLKQSNDPDEFRQRIKSWAQSKIDLNPTAHAYFKSEIKGAEAFGKLNWQDFAVIRILEYIRHAGVYYKDLNLRGRDVLNDPFLLLWLAYKHGTGGAQEDFFRDMIHLFRQFSEKDERVLPSRSRVADWMDNHPSGLDPEIIRIREKNKGRIINKIIDKIDSGNMLSSRFHYKAGLTRGEKYEIVSRWWDDYRFHLKFAIRDPGELNEMMEHTIEDSQMKLLQRGKEAGIPTFVNLYYLSLLNITEPDFAPGCDSAMREYVFLSKELVEEFGHIVAWEKEDIVEAGKPNAAGWILPFKYNMHRRYPEVAILLPDTAGRACAGLCVPCQRMYDFQRGHLNFNLEKLHPTGKWKEKLEKLMKYFEDDKQLRDILITGGDALMSSNSSIKNILDSIYSMAMRKKESNLKRPEGEKYAEIQRIRLGTRLPVYLPQRIDAELIEILKDFKKKASAIGIQQFVIQTHIQTSMEITPELKKAVEMLATAGWIITNQLVFTTASSRRGHTARLRKILNDIGIITYYTFSVKGYKENSRSYATMARAVQEQIEEKVLGDIPKKYIEVIKALPEDAENIKARIAGLREEASLPFLATDRSVLNMPGVGKSLTFRVIGITRHGRRILHFEHDATRRHSPIVHAMDTVVIIESKTINQYLKQISRLGEEPKDYRHLYGYSMGETEEVMPTYQYPDYDFEITDGFSNFAIPSD